LSRGLTTITCKYTIGGCSMFDDFLLAREPEMAEIAAKMEDQR
jgi:hypothetical protein